jgi:branched-chain amino acid transport system substrate-binding protein
MSSQALHKTLKQFAAIGIVSSAAFAATSTLAGGVSATEIVVGSHIDLSGPAAPGMPYLRNAMQMRLDEANQAGGIHGRKFRLIVEDNGSQPQLAVRAVQKMIKSDDVFAVINAFGSGPNAATVKMAVDAGVVVFAPWAASAIIQRVSGNHPLVFTTVQNYNTTTASGLSWALKNWGSKKVGVIYQEGPFGDLVRAGVKDALTAAGQTVAAEAAYKPGDIDFSSQVARMKSAGVDLILAGTIIRESIGVMAEVRKLGWNDVKVLTALPGRSTIVAKLGKETTEGMYGIGGWRLYDTDPSEAEAKKFFTAYKQRFNQDADENAANAYSYTDWFVRIVQAAGPTLTAEGFAKAAQTVPHSDFTTYARQTFIGNHMSPEYASVDQVKGGKWTQITQPFTGLVK